MNILPSNTASIVVQSKAEVISQGRGLQLNVLPASDTVSVAESCSSLRAIFSAPEDFGGSNVSQFLVEWWDTPSAPEVQQISLFSAGPFYGTFRLSFNGFTSDYIPYNASEATIQSELRALFDIVDVLVLKIPVNNGSIIGNLWQITFPNNFPTVYNQQLSIDFSGVASLVGQTIMGGVSVLQAAALPHGYQTMVVAAIAGVKTYQVTLGNLIPGVPYFVQVSSVNDMGVSLAQTSLPTSLAPPLQAPSEPQDVYLVTQSANALRILWIYPESDGGDAVNSYKVQNSNLRSTYYPMRMLCRWNGIPLRALTAPPDRLSAALSASRRLSTTASSHTARFPSPDSRKESTTTCVFTP